MLLLEERFISLLWVKGESLDPLLQNALQVWDTSIAVSSACAYSARRRRSLWRSYPHLKVCITKVLELCLMTPLLVHPTPSKLTRDQGLLLPILWDQFPIPHRENLLLRGQNGKPWYDAFHILLKFPGLMAVKSNNQYLKDWLAQDCQRFLDSLYTQEHINYHGRQQCQSCGTSDCAYCCLDCAQGCLLCKECILDCHAQLPFHGIQEWCGTHFSDVSLTSLGFVLELGHEGHQCDLTKASSNKQGRAFKTLDLAGDSR